MVTVTMVNGLALESRIELHISNAISQPFFQGQSTNSESLSALMLSIGHVPETNPSGRALLDRRASCGYMQCQIFTAVFIYDPQHVKEFAVGSVAMHKVAGPYVIVPLQHESNAVSGVQPRCFLARCFLLEHLSLLASKSALGGDN